MGFDPPSVSVRGSRTRTGGVLAVVLVLLIIAVGLTLGAVYFFKDKIIAFVEEKVPTAPAIEAPASPVNGSLVLERVDIYRQGPVEVASVQEIPGQIVALMQEQSTCFHAVIDAAERVQNRGLSPEQAARWEEILKSFPEKVYFSEPLAGQFETGPQAAILARHGENNTHSMSVPLYDQFYGIAAQADPLNLSAAITTMEQKLNAELKWRELRRPHERSSDPFTRAKSSADLAWLHACEDYLTVLKDALSEFPQDGGISNDDHNQCVAAWKNFNAQNGAKLAQWYATAAQAPTAYYTPSVNYSAAGCPVARIPFGGHYLYLIPDTAPEEIIFTQQP